MCTHTNTHMHTHAHIYSNTFAYIQRHTLTHPYSHAYRHTQTIKGCQLLSLYLSVFSACSDRNSTQVLEQLHRIASLYCLRPMVHKPGTQGSCVSGTGEGNYWGKSVRREGIFPKESLNLTLHLIQLKCISTAHNIGFTIWQNTDLSNRTSSSGRGQIS